MKAILLKVRWVRVNPVTGHRVIRYTWTCRTCCTRGYASRDWQTARDYGLAHLKRTHNDLYVGGGE